MKHVLRRSLSLILSVVMLFGLCSSVFADSSPKKYNFYYVMGDSIPWEIGTDMFKAEGCIDHNKCVYAYNRQYENDHLGRYAWNEGQYAELVAEHYGITDGYFGANQGWRTHEARISINPNYDGDEHTAVWEFPWAGDTLKRIQDSREGNIAELKKADLITINLGNNNIIGTLAVCIYKVFGTDFDEDGVLEAKVQEILDTAASMPAEEAVYYMFCKLYEVYGDVTEVLKLVSEGIVKSMDEFGESWDSLITDIRGINKNADIVVIGMYNAMGNALAANFDGVDPKICDALKKLTDPVVKYFNFYMETGSSKKSEYVFADVSDVDLTGSREGSHLGKVGHEYFAKKIIEALDILNAAPCQHDGTTSVKKAKAATKWTLGYSGDTVCDKCGETISRGHITVYKCPHTNTKISCAIAATHFTAGYTGNVICTDCLKILSLGKIVKPGFLKK